METLIALLKQSRAKDINEFINWLNFTHGVEGLEEFTMPLYLRGGAYWKEGLKVHAYAAVMTALGQKRVSKQMDRYQQGLRVAA